MVILLRYEYWPLPQGVQVSSSSSHNIPKALQGLPTGLQTPARHHSMPLQNRPSRMQGVLSTSFAIVHSPSPPQTFNWHSSAPEHSPCGSVKPGGVQRHVSGLQQLSYGGSTDSQSSPSSRIPFSHSAEDRQVLFCSSQVRPAAQGLPVPMQPWSASQILLPLQYKLSSGHLASFGLLTHSSVARLQLSSVQAMPSSQSVSISHVGSSGRQASGAAWGCAQIHHLSRQEQAATAHSPWATQAS